MFWEFLDHLESRLHFTNGWPGKFFWRRTWIHYFPKDMTVPYLASFAHVLDIVAPEFFRTLPFWSQTSKKPVFTLLVLKSTGLFFQVPIWFCCYFWAGLRFFRVLNWWLPFLFLLKIQWWLLTSETSLVPLEVAGKAQGLTSNNVPALRGAQLQTWK